MLNCNAFLNTIIILNQNAFLNIVIIVNYCTVLIEEHQRTKSFRTYTTIQYAVLYTFLLEIEHCIHNTHFFFYRMGNTGGVQLTFLHIFSQVEQHVCSITIFAYIFFLQGKHWLGSIIIFTYIFFIGGTACGFNYHLYTFFLQDGEHWLIQLSPLYIFFLQDEQLVGSIINFLSSITRVLHFYGSLMNRLVIKKMDSTANEPASQRP